MGRVINDVWKFNMMDIIDHETNDSVRLKMIVEDMEARFLGGKDKRIGNYPWLYLLDRLMQEIEKRNWIIRDEQLEKAYIYLRDRIIDRQFFDEKKDRRDFETGVYRNAYAIESPEVEIQLKNMIQAVKRYRSEW